jgi:hypothetical protein
MQEFEAGHKRKRDRNETERTTYGTKEFTEKDAEKMKHKPIGGNVQKKQKKR